jgi:DNA gyrase subunit A
VVHDELTALGDKFGQRRRTKLGADETPDFDPEAYILKENTNVVLTRDGWIKRVGRLASVEGTRVREGDAVVAVAPGNTLDHVVFLADDGVAYTMRMNEVPVSSGYGEPLAKYFRLNDQAKVINAISTDERFTAADEPARNGEPGGPYLLVVTERGFILRTPLASYRTASTKVGRRYARLATGDRVVWVTIPRDEESIFLASANGHVIHFPLEQVNILAGVGRGVTGIKLRPDDRCLGGALISTRFDMMQVETAGEKTLEFRRGKYEVTSRGGKGFAAVKRTTFVRVVPPPIELVNWDELEQRRTEGQGNGSPTLFD